MNNGGMGRGNENTAFELTTSGYGWMEHDGLLVLFYIC